MRNFTNKDFTEDSLNQLENSTETGDNMLVPSSVGSDNKSWAKKTFSKIYDYIKGKLNITSNSPTLSFGSTSTIGSVGGEELKVTMPDKPSYNLDEISETSTRFFRQTSSYSLTEAGWYTVATLKYMHIYKLSFTNTYNAVYPQGLEFTISFGYKTGHSLILNNVERLNGLTKIRLVTIDNTTCRLDVFYNVNGYINLYSTLEYDSLHNVSIILNSSRTIAPEITTESYKEYDIYNHPHIYNQDFSLDGSVTAQGYKVPNGTSSQFLKGDGSVDSNTYLTAITSAMVTNALGFTPISDVSDKADKCNTVATAQYNNTTKKIEFYNIDGTKLATDIDATDFIKDGMVNEVKVENGKLIITFNTDAGKNDIEININTIFNANNYYTKSEIEAKGYLTEHQSLEGYVNNIIFSGEGNGISGVAKQGSIIQFTKTEFLTSHQEVIPNNPTLNYGQPDIVIGKIGDKELKVSMPELPTIADEKVKQTHTSANINRSILLAVDNGTTTFTDGAYKNSGVTVNTSTKKITSSGFVVNGSSSDYMLLGDGTTQAEHNTRNHEFLFVENLQKADEFIDNYFSYFIKGQDEKDTFIIAPFNGVAGQIFDFSILTEYIKNSGEVSKKRFHIYIEYTGNDIYIIGCMSDTDLIKQGCAKLECYFDEKMGVWFVEYNKVFQVKGGKNFDGTTYNEYCDKYLKR